MAEPTKTGIPVVDTAVATAIATAVEIARAERLADAVAAAATDAGEHKGKSKKNARGMGKVTETAIHAGFVVFADGVGSGRLPTTRDGIAKAIADTAEELGLTSSDTRLDHESGSVRNVASIVLKAAGTTAARDKALGGAPKEKLPEVAGTRRARLIRPV